MFQTTYSFMHNVYMDANKPYASTPSFVTPSFATPSFDTPSFIMSISIWYISPGHIGPRHYALNCNIFKNTKVSFCRFVLWGCLQHVHIPYNSYPSCSHGNKTPLSSWHMKCGQCLQIRLQNKEQGSSYCFTT